MKTIYAMVITALVAFTGISSAAHADCLQVASADAACYVDYVRLYVHDNASTNDTYVMAGISDPYGLTDCSTIKVKQGTAGADIAAIKRAETVLMTALATQLPVAFTVKSGTSTCVVDDLAIQRQAN